MLQRGGDPAGGTVGILVEWHHALPIYRPRDLLEVTPMGKLKAFLVHLLVSVIVVSALLLLLISRWYPMPYFLADGGW